MQLHPRVTRGLIAFVLFDLLLVLVMVFLYQAKSAREVQVELRDLGVTIYPQPRELQSFTLVDQHGKDFSNANFEGVWSLVFFGFTECPDICPLTMTELGQFYELLDKSEQDQLRIILVTVDPRRDTPDAMGTYLAKYNEDFVGLSGAAEAIQRLAEKLYVTHTEPPAEQQQPQHQHQDDASRTSTEYLINHSAHISVINPQGENFAVMRPPHRDQDIARAYQMIRNF